MDNAKLKKIGNDLSRARSKLEEWDRRTKELERKYREAENTCIHEMVRAAEISPEQLEELIKAASSGSFGILGGKQNDDGKQNE